MGRSLSELICLDLAELAHYGSDVVASEESIRCLVALYNKQRNLHNAHVIHIEKLQSFLEDTLDIDALKKSPGHYQFVIEVGARSKISRGDRATAHYCSVDFYFRPETKPLAFVVDHNIGHRAYHDEFKKIAEELGVHFVIPGGALFQTDAAHCPIFSINNLLTTAHDEEIPVLLDRIVGDGSNGTHTLFHWNELPPRYVYPSQSVTMLFDYLDAITAREALSKEQDVPALKNSPFANFLPVNLYPVNSYSDIKLNNKVRNKSIKRLTAQMAANLVLALETTPSEFSEEDLISICYESRYPEVHNILRNALEFSKKFPVLDQSHPLFELAFSFAIPLEACLKDKRLKDIFLDETILGLMQQGLLDAGDLFTATSGIYGREMTVDKDTCQRIKSNLPGMAIVVSCLEKHPEANLQNISNLLLSRNCSTFFKNPKLSALFVKGFLSVEHIVKIQAYKIDLQEFNSRDSELEMLAYLDGTFSLEMGLTQAEELPLSSVPAIGANDEEVMPVKKPVINKGLIARVSKVSIFAAAAAHQPDEDVASVPNSPTIIDIFA